MSKSESTRITGAILAGGSARRFGQEKCSALLDGKPLVRHVYDAMRPLVDEILLSTGPSPGPTFDLDAIPVIDLMDDAGPLSGIAACLEAAAHPWLLVVACDLPRITGNTLSRMIHAAQLPHQVVLLRSEKGRTQPLCACYHRSILDSMRLALEEGHYGVHLFLDTLQHVHELPALDSELLNINRPGDLPPGLPGIRD